VASVHKQENSDEEDVFIIRDGCCLVGQ